MTVKTKEVKKKNGEKPTPKVGQDSKTMKKAASELVQMTVEERFNKLEEFQALERKHSKIKAKNQSLKVLKRSNDSLGAEITISAGSEEISLNNAALVGEVLDLLSGKLDEISKETENEVLSFVI
jgi:predicted HicB family RNase H-like nuclease